MLVLGLALLTLAVAPGSSAATYKWVDEKGVVHYSDKMPPDAVNRGSTELSKEGVPLRRTEPALTPEQRRAREVDAERARATAKQRDEADRRDHALLASYTTEEEIELSRVRSLATIDAALQSAQAYSDQLAKQRVDVEARRKALGSKPVPPVLDRELEGIAAEFDRQAKLIRQKRAERDATIARYESDRARWRELKGLGAAGSATGAPGNLKPPPSATAK